jgi:acetyltransferase-like isoleucine patch superfamily enzyme
MSDVDGLQIHPTAIISPDARIFGSSRGTRVVIGAGAQIEPFALIRCVGGMGDVIIGDNCYVNPFCVLYSGNGIRLGNDVLLAPGVQVVPANHNWERRDVPIRQQGFRPSRGGVEIEDDVWVGANTVILDGARIGRGAIIGAGSVVSGVIPAYEMWAGNPASKLRDRP